MKKQKSTKSHTKSIFANLINQLADKDYGVIPGAFVYCSSNMALVAKYALLQRDGINEKNYIARRKSLCKKMELTPSELELLLAVIRDDRESYMLYALAKKFHLQQSELHDTYESLVQKGYFVDCDDFLTKDDVIAVSTDGIMSCISEVSIKNLDRSYFVSIYAKYNNTETDIETPQSNPYVPEILGEDKPSKPTNSPYEQPFMECLRSFARDYGVGMGFTAGDFVAAMDANSHNPQNERFHTALVRLGYNNLEEEQRATLLLLCNHFAEKGIEPLELADCDMISAAKVLVTAGLVDVPPREVCGENENNSSNKNKFLISAEVAGTLFHGMTELIDYSTLCRQADVWKTGKIEPKDLYFDGKLGEQVDNLMRMFSKENNQHLIDKLAGAGRKSLVFMFYGASGTGKTELCRQIARQSGRDCIVADPAKLNGSLWGECEKNARELFRAYRYLYKISDIAPILVFNEADSVISKRVTVTRPIDKSENAVQAIILQELETFEGIMIATTNLENNIDEAMDRRILFKLQFEIPSPESRAKMFIQKIKDITPEQSQALAREFTISGGQIDNIATKALIQELMTNEKPTFQEIRTMCMEELQMRNSNKPNKIGFITD